MNNMAVPKTGNDPNALRSAFIYSLTDPIFRRALGKAMWRTLPFVFKAPAEKTDRTKFSLLQKVFYELMADLNTDAGMTCMNLGYAGLETPHTCTLSEEDEINRYSLQLYDYLFKFSEPSGKEVLEVGCGRGGGAKFLYKTYNPTSYLGVDFAQANIAFCKRIHSEAGLRFEAGRAESLVIADNSKDIILNVESSHCYVSPAAFFKEVQRILKPGGLFLFADIRGEDVNGYQTLPILEAQFNALEEMILVDKTNITKNAMRALELTGERQVTRWRAILKESLKPGAKSERFIEQVLEPELRGVYSPDVPESAWSWYSLFKNGGAEYWSYVFRKKECW